MGFEDFLHVGITDTDLEKSIWFYTHVMGMEIEARAEVAGEKISRVVHVEDADIDICLVKKNNMRMDLLDYQNTQPGNNSVPRNRRGVFPATNALPSWNPCDPSAVFWLAKEPRNRSKKFYV